MGDTALSSLLVNLSFLSPKPTGISIYARSLVPHLRSLHPTLLTAQYFPSQPCYHIPDNLTPEQGSRGHFSRLIWTQFQLPKIYQKLKGNLLFSPVPEAPLFSGCRSVVMVHDLIPLRFPRRFAPLTLYARHYVPQVLNQATHIICNSAATAEDIQRFYQVPAHKITSILLAYDENHFRFLDLPTENYFLYLGRIDPYKNVSQLIEAFAAIPSKKECELWIAGPGDRRYLPALEAQVKQLNLSHRVKFLDYVPHDKLPALLNRAIALVFPSLWEGFGLPVLEAMACGTPVITSNLSSLPEVTGDAALLIDPQSVSQITAAMEEMFDDRALRMQLRHRGLARAKTFSWSKTGQETARVLEKYL